MFLVSRTALHRDRDKNWHLPVGDGQPNSESRPSGDKEATELTSHYRNLQKNKV